MDAAFEDTRSFPRLLKKSSYIWGRDTNVRCVPLDSLSGVGGNCLECVRLFVGGTYGGGVIVPAVDYQQPNKTSWQPSECLQLRVFGQPPVGDDITFSETGAIFAISIAIAVGSAQLPAPAGSHPAGAAPGPDAAQPVPPVDLLPEGRGPDWNWRIDSTNRPPDRMVPAPYTPFLGQGWADQGGGSAPGHEQRMSTFCRVASFPHLG